MAPINYGDLYRLLDNDSKLFFAYNYICHFIGIMPDDAVKTTIPMMREHIYNGGPIRKRGSVYSTYTDVDSIRHSDNHGPLITMVGCARRACLHMLRLAYKIKTGEHMTRIIGSLSQLLQYMRYAGTSNFRAPSGYEVTEDYKYKLQFERLLLDDLSSIDNVQATHDAFNPDIRALAKSIAYGDDIPGGILADALEDHGSLDTNLLLHLRKTGKHYPGCYAVRRILGAPPYA